MSIVSPRPEVSVVIPTYNEEDNVRQIHEAVRHELESHAASYEIIFVDNCSTDATRALLREICVDHPSVRAIFNSRNYGQMRSPTYAIYQAEGAAVIGMCADFQDPPTLIGPMIAQWREGAQIVLGARISERAGAMTRLSRWLGYQVLGRLADYEIVPGATGFGLFDRRVVDALAAWNEPEPFFRGMVVESGYRTAVIRYHRPDRAAGKTKNDFRALTDFAISGLAGSSKSLLRAPLYAVPYAGLIAVLGFVGTVAAAFFNGPAWHLALLTTLLAMFTVMLAVLGLIGEQVRVIAERTRNVPLVLEAERLNFPADRSAPSLRTYVKSAESK